MIRKKHKSCGAVIFKKIKESGKIEYLIIQHINKSGGHFDFPKGHVERDETEKETAKREIKEETGLNVFFIEGFRETINYIDYLNNVDKEVVFFLCEARTQNVKIQEEEIQSYVWLEFDDAMTRLTHDNAKNVLLIADDFLKQNIYKLKN